jgi:hypothetical protein
LTMRPQRRRRISGMVATASRHALKALVRCPGWLR